MENGFGIRLGRAIDRWPGGGQRAFAKALEDYARQNDLRIPTSYRTLLNYLGGHTRPSTAWVEAAAAVLRWNPENLLTGKGPERPAGKEPGLRITIEGAAIARVDTLSDLIFNRYVDLPLAVRWMMFNFVDELFENDDADWEDYEARREDVERVLREYFRPLLTRHTMSDAATKALAASLTAAAYVRSGHTSPTKEES